MVAARKIARRRNITQNICYIAARNKLVARYLVAEKGA
jgi:hypothetical protein